MSREVAPLIELLAEQHGLLRAREILTVWAGFKSARVGIPPADLASFTRIVEALGLAWRCSSQKYFGKRDIGKGGWSNKFGGTAPANSSLGDWLIYVARDAATAEAAREAEEDNREIDFGHALGVPVCCAEFYSKYKDAAYLKQNDYVPFVLDQTVGEPPYDLRLNYVAQYFGYALISFFPCSFTCHAAANVAQRTLELLQCHAPRLAEETVRMQKCPILYTEYRGVYLFEKTSWEKNTGRLWYDPQAIRGTLPPYSAVSRKLRAGCSLKIESKHAAVVQQHGQAVATLKGANVSICLF